MKKRLRSILLIDDDEPTNFFHKLIAEETRCAEQVLAVQGGQDALDYLADIKTKKGNISWPDIIFLDINMPAMDGWEFLDKFQQIKKENGTKVIMIMLTTSLNPDDEIRSKDIPVITGFVNKPLTVPILYDIIKSHFPENF